VRGAPILTVFFAMFTIASLLIPSPMFPGNVFCDMIGEAISQYAKYLSAFLNGVFYGVTLWLFFAAISRRFDQEK